jgi:hypothetical protein
MGTLRSVPWNAGLGEIGATVSTWPQTAQGAVEWAMQAGDGLAYILALDERAFASADGLMGFDREVVEVAHMRAAVTQAITSVDLCAAAILELHGLATKKRSPRNCAHSLDFSRSDQDVWAVADERGCLGQGRY